MPNKRILIVALGLTAVLVGALVIPRGGSTSTGPSGPPQAGRLADHDRKAEGEEAGPEDWFVSQRLAGGTIPDGAPQRAAAQAQALAVTTAAVDAPLAGARWVSVGPTNIGGRVVDIAVDPVAPDTIYVAAASGGVWKSTDKGITYTQSWPQAFPQAMGALAVASDGTLFAGTGEANPGGGSITYGGQGVYRSRDGGLTWTNVGLTGVSTIGRIAVDPTDPQRIFVAATGNLFVSGGDRGVYESTDGGDSWTQVLAGTNGTTGAVDVAIDPSNPQRVYAAMWDHLRQPNLRTYGGVGSGVYRSIDGGATWTRLSNGLPAASANNGRIGIAMAPSNPNRLYAILIQTGGTFQGFYTSTDGGDSWTKLPDSGTLSGAQSTYGWWFGRVWVDPVNESHLFAAGVSLCESKNAGSTWTSQFTQHADDHAMAWDPNVAQRVYLGTDGGVYRSDNNGTSWTFATYQPWTQFYSVDVSEQDGNRIVGGTQDNNALRSWPTNWNSYVGGDGEETLIDPTNQNKIYGCSQYGACERSTNGGSTMLSFGFTTSDRYNWFTPVQFDPSNPAVMYLGGNRLNRSTNSAQTFSVISPDLTGGPGPDPNYPFGTLTTVAAANTDGNVLFVGTDDGRVWFTTDLGGHWTRATDPGLPQIWVSRVAVDPTAAAVAYATFSGYRAGSPIPHVMKTVDGGVTWASVAGNLPQAPVNDILVSGSRLYVATDVGVYLSQDGGASWLKVGKGLPNAPVTDIEVRAASSVLYAATFGRGVYRIKVPA